MSVPSVVPMLVREIGVDQNGCSRPWVSLPWWDLRSPPAMRCVLRQHLERCLLRIDGVLVQSRCEVFQRNSCSPLNFNTEHTPPRLCLHAHVHVRELRLQVSAGIFLQVCPVLHAITLV